MTVTLWGTRGSLSSPGSDTLRYGGNTSCVEVRAAEGTLLVLDAGTGIRRLGERAGPLARVDLLLTHLHMDHLQGLGFFDPLYVPGLPVDIWGPPSATRDLRARLGLYLSPPLFPVHMRDLPSRLTLHDVPLRRFEIGPFAVTAALVVHPGPTVGYRIECDRAVVAYIPDHEPALGARHFPEEPEWTSGYDLARGADLLLHDAQYGDAEYAAHVGWGHSSVSHALAFAAFVGAKRLIPFHHDPSHNDEEIDQLLRDALRSGLPFEVVPGTEGLTVRL